MEIMISSEMDQFDKNSHLAPLNDIDEMSSKFSDIELAHLYVHVKTVTIRNTDKWWLNSSRKAMSIQDHLHKQLIYAYTYMVKCVREQFFINVTDILDNEGK